MITHEVNATVRFVFAVIARCKEEIERIERISAWMDSIHSEISTYEKNLPTGDSLISVIPKLKKLHNDRISELIQKEGFPGSWSFKSWKEERHAVLVKDLKLIVHELG